MSHSSSEALSDGDDDAEPGQSRVTRAKRPCPSASDVVALPVAVPVARVIRAAAAASRSMPACHGGYSPTVAVGMAGAHSWAPYSAIIPTLRSLLLMNLKEETSLRAAREAITGLYDHATPFGASRRFPAGEVYVCLDRVPLAQTMQRIVQPLVTVEAAGMFGEQLVDACSNYIGGISSALLDLTRVEDRPGISPVLYDRAIFESVFLLTWTEP
ncbi:uncharacterized protein [Aegilops tauschii subsp. strangulata]|uniref:Uncharacterized protein n=1 Tax=Aegilops tauschii subsp. strangulata TaxID=200361 RepID=A0A453M6G1_AEGTS|nr:uncharacterized protein LOC109767828 [Aegilops tauschii subsp. strangulata]